MLRAMWVKGNQNGVCELSPTNVTPITPLKTKKVENLSPEPMSEIKNCIDRDFLIASRI
jgi:hypothetical protein